MKTGAICVLSGFLLVTGLPLAAAEWSECRRVKRDVVTLQQALREGRKLKGYKSGAAMKRARRDGDIWLRKHCRYYSRRLRDIERQMM